MVRQRHLDKNDSGEGPQRMSGMGRTACGSKGCRLRAFGGKPYCSAHVEANDYASVVLGRIAEVGHDQENPDSGGILAGDYLQALAGGPQSLGMIPRLIMSTHDTVRALTIRLEAEGKIKLSRVSRRRVFVELA